MSSRSNKQNSEQSNRHADDQDRNDTRRLFLEQHGWENACSTALKPDASFRHYFRLTKNDQRCLLMDAPPSHENSSAFVNITRHLIRIGIRCPEILSFDKQNGFLLIEDLGDDTFTRLLAQSDTQNEGMLYNQALELLIKLQTNPDNTAIDVAHYDFKTLFEEAELLIDWYYPARYGQKIGQPARRSFKHAWQEIYSLLPSLQPVLVLRDFHVDNLMRIDDQCAVIDYQDALTGSPAYDLASLLEDARRDIDPELINQLKGKYLKHMPAGDTQAFNDHYSFWATQRHCKVAGIFVRLWLRDHKSVYLKHLPRTINLMHRHTSHPLLHPFARWLEQNMPASNQHTIHQDNEQIKRALHQ